MEGDMNKGMKLLIITHQSSLYQHIRRMVSNHADADDVMQNVLVKVYRAIEKFESKSKLSTWLYRIATNETLTFLKKEKERMKTTSRNDTQLIELKADSYIEEGRIIMVLEKAISLLPEKQKLVFNMRYFDEMSYNEISSVLQLTTGGLKASFHHAVKKIEAFIKENEIG